VTSGLRIVVLGYMIRGPLGGFASYHLQYLEGLRRLGHDVYFLEDSDDYPSCYDPATTDTGVDPSYGLGFAARVFDRCGFGERWAYWNAHTAQWSGPCADSAIGICERADLLLNIGGVNPIRPWMLPIPTRALIDLDPAFTQIRHLTNPASRRRAELHTAFFSVGANIGSPQCSVPDDGLPWQPTRQPAVLDCWPVTIGPASGRFTTVMLWDSYAPVVFAGRRFGMKSDSFLPYLDLPRVSGTPLEVAAGSASTPAARLLDGGWSVRDSSMVTQDPWSYRDYIQSSKAEFSVAKQGYVSTRSGWFSDRSVAYLASGRPVVLQDTGFSDWLPAGSGLVAFNTPDQAVAGLDEINSRYRQHCRDARALAEEWFDASRVLSRLVDDASATRPSLVARPTGLAVSEYSRR